MRTPRLTGKKPVYNWGKGLERHRVVVGVERRLVVFVTEVDAERKCRVAAMLLARVPVELEMMEIEIPLEKTVLTDRPVDVRSHIGLQHRRCVFGMVHRAQQVADI